MVVGCGAAVFGVVGVYYVYGCSKGVCGYGYGGRRRGASGGEQKAEKTGEERGPASEISVDCLTRSDAVLKLKLELASNDAWRAERSL